MVIIPIKEHENIERALKRYKNKCDRIRLVQEVKRRRTYVKPSLKRRKELQKAIYMNQFKTKKAHS